jgi:multidrug efflux pump subunit AcrA (membrane-fusion protein)
VQKGQILAILDTENLENDIRQAELSLENAEINYQDLENG